MDREIVLFVLALWVCGPILLGSGLFPLKRGRPTQLLPSQNRGWGLVWWPVIPAAVVFAVLVGWALQEPAAADEGFRPFVFLGVIPIVLIWTRAAIRAVRALIRYPLDAPAFTIGLIRPRVILSPALVQALDPEALYAVEEHEAAHVRHRDPARIWLARLVTDMSWPWPAPRKRFERWLSALEIVRDDEARARGVNGADLAAAILAAVEMSGHAGGTPGATLVGEEEMLRLRIERLLEPLPPAAAPHSRARLWLRPLLISGTLVLAVAFGNFFGERAVKTLPGVVCLPHSSPSRSAPGRFKVSWRMTPASRAERLPVSGTGRTIKLRTGAARWDSGVRFG